MFNGEGNGYSLSDLAAVTNNDGFGGGNGSWWIIVLFLFCFMGGFGNNTTAASTSDLQRAVDLNSIQEGQANIAADVQRGIYEINGATKDAAYNNLSEIRDVQASVANGNANIINNLTALQAQMQSCCCEQKALTLENRYLDAQNTAAINANTTAATQKILDALAQNKIDALQAQVSELKTQNMFCGIPRISNYAYGVYPYSTSGCGCMNA